jgi:hypothetical protein
LSSGRIFREADPDDAPVSDGSRNSNWHVGWMDGPGAVRGLRREGGAVSDINRNRLDERGSAVMNAHPMGEPAERVIDTGDQTIAALRHITAEQLRHLGTRQVVYLRSGIRDGEHAFAVYGADGIPLVVVDDVDTAVAMAAERGFGFVAVH